MKFDLADLNKYYDPKDVGNYEVFIGPHGEYYKVRTKYDSTENLTHYKWAEEYIRRNNLESFERYAATSQKSTTPLDFLTNCLGFVRYTHAHSGRRKAYITLPNPYSVGYRLNSEQIEAIYKLMDYNNDDISSDLIEMIEEHKEGKTNINEHIYNKIVQNRR